MDERIVGYFFSNLFSRKNNSAFCAIMRKGVGRYIGDNSDARDEFYRSLAHPNMAKEDEQHFFDVACLFASYPNHVKGNFFYRELSQNNNTPGLDLRLQHLLRCSRRSLPREIFNLINAYIKKNNNGIDYIELFWDTYKWGMETKRSWARGFYMNREEEKTDATEG